MKRLKLLLFALLTLGTANATFPTPPGVVVDHIPASSGMYIGSPGLCILPDGKYIASHDFFGPKSTEHQSARTLIFTSKDKGLSWQKATTIEGQFWSNLFYHNGALYLMGTNKGHGNVIIRRSDDEGKTWTTPSDTQHGLILEGEYHTAPMPVVVHKGRIWRAVEYATATTTKWPERYSATMLSAPMSSDLLNARNWRRSESLHTDYSALGGNVRGWLEGNAVITPDGRIVNMLRVHTPKCQQEYTAIVRVSRDGRKLSFDAEKDLVQFPGGSKKFAVRYDTNSERYWSLVNYTDGTHAQIQPDRVRNTLAVASSIDLKNWTVHEILLHHPDPLKHGFQYVEWLIDGNDIIYLVRTAFDDAEGQAANYHNSNYMTFHRLVNFRSVAAKTLAQ